MHQRKLSRVPFRYSKGGHHYTASAVSIPKEDFVDKYILSNSRTLTPQEESTVPILEDWYVIPKRKSKEYANMPN